MYGALALFIDPKHIRKLVRELKQLYFSWFPYILLLFCLSENEYQENALCIWQ
jgi:hypothetical protein